MKFGIIAVFFTILAVPYCQAGLNCLIPHWFRRKADSAAETSLNNQERKMEDFHPEKSLSFIKDKESVLCGVALVTPKCGITISEPLKDYVNKPIAAGTLFIGIGIEPSKEKYENFLHSVSRVTNNNEEKDTPNDRLIAIVIFKLDETKIPKNLNFIPVKEFSLDFVYYQKIKGMLVMWDKSNNIKTIEFTKLFFKPGNKRQTLLLYSLRKEEIDVHSKCQGGFITNERGLGGVLKGSEKMVYNDEIQFDIVWLQITRKFVEKAAPGEEITYEDLFKTYTRKDTETGEFQEWVIS